MRPVQAAYPAGQKCPIAYKRRREKHCSHSRRERREREQKPGAPHCSKGQGFHPRQVHEPVYTISTVASTAQSASKSLARP